ncbi:MAG: TonB family protein [Halanaerobium sp.]|nr:TonB family protein [Halanaerobium sp.]
MRNGRLWKFITLSLLVHLIVYLFLPAALFRADSSTLSLGDSEYIQEVAFVNLEEEKQEPPQIKQEDSQPHESVPEQKIQEETKQEEPAPVEEEPAVIEEEQPVEEEQVLEAPEEETAEQANPEQEKNPEPSSLRDGEGSGDKEGSATVAQEPVQNSEEPVSQPQEEQVAAAETSDQNEGDQATPEVMTSEHGQEELNLGETVADDSNTPTGTDGTGEGQGNTGKEEEPEFVPPAPASLVASKTSINYPKDAVNQGLEGSIEVQVDVSVAGSVSDVKLISKTGIEEFDQVALIIRRYWQFKASLYPYHLYIQVDFDLEKGQPKVTIDRVEFDRGDE